VIAIGSLAMTWTWEFQIHDLLLKRILVLTWLWS